MAYMFEVRLHQSPELTQRYTSSMLFIMGFFSVFAAPVIGHFADQTPSRKVPLLISLAGCTLGTALVAATPSVAVVFVGRLLQGVAGTGAWIVSFAMLTDSIDKKHFGKTLGFASSFVTAGVLTGPAVAGSLLEWLGYWPAWTVPFALLGIDLVARLVMVEEKAKEKEEDKEQQDPDSEAQETTALLNDGEPAPEAESNTKEAPPVNALTFYRIMLSQPPVLAGLANVITFSLMVAAFDATFPLHLRSAFHWGPAPIGLIFLGIQIPAMIFAPAVGWLRDRVGLKWPTALGWLLMAPIMWFLGVPGEWKVPGLEDQRRAQAAFVAGIVALGCVSPLSRGAGTFAMSGEIISTTLKLLLLTTMQLLCANSRRKTRQSSALMVVARGCSP